MPIKQLALEDLTATLQVPIPGIPGAYGEIELSGDGTATIALGAEIPVPFLDDMVNGEIQVEIDKEGEIAYGVEINLVGLQLETMIRGCDIVTTLSYGALSTEAVYRIPDCEEPEPPEPPPLPPPGEGDDYDEEIEEPIEFPVGYDDDDKVVVVEYEVGRKYYKRDYNTVASTLGYASWYEETRNSSWRQNLVDYRPDMGTELYETTGKWKYQEKGSEVPAYSNTINSDGSRGWINGVNIQPVHAANLVNWLPGTPIPDYLNYWIDYFYRFPINHIGKQIAGTVREVKQKMAEERRRYSSIKTRRKKTNVYEENVYWDGMASFSFITYSNGVLVEQTPAYLGLPSSAGRPYQYLHTNVYTYVDVYHEDIEKRIAVKKLDENKLPPLQGEPPMKDCCADIRAELRRLRKELKETRTKYVEPIYAVVSPDGFTEKILPVELDKDGKEIKRSDKKAITLPTILQALGKVAGLEIPTDYLKIPDLWIPKSWKKPLYEKAASKLKLPDTKTVPFAFAIKVLSQYLYKMAYALDPDDIQFSKVPTRFIKPGAGTSEFTHASNYPELLAMVYQMIDNYGFHPFAVSIRDANLSQAGDQPKHQEFLSLGAALKHIITNIEDMNSESNVQVEMLVRLAYEAMLTHQISADSQKKLQNLEDFLGYEVNKVKVPLKMAFNPLAGESATSAAEKGEQALEEQLPGFLDNTSTPIVVSNYTGGKTLLDFLMEILNAARQKPKGNKWG